LFRKCPNEEGGDRGRKKEKAFFKEGGGGTKLLEGDGHRFPKSHWREKGS